MELGGIFFLLLIFFLSSDTSVFHYVGRRLLLLRKHVHTILHCCACVIHPSILFNHCFFLNSRLLVSWYRNFLVLLFELLKSISFSDPFRGFQQSFLVKLNCLLAKTVWNGRKWCIHKLFNSLLLIPPLLLLCQNLPYVRQATKERDEKERNEEITRRTEPKQVIVILILWSSRIMWIIFKARLCPQSGS